MFAEVAGAPLTDDALFLQANVLVALARPADAVAVLDALAERDPLSFFRDRALLLQARLYEGPLADPTAAAVHYERLLELFPGSLFAPEARLQLRRLRAAA